MSIDRTNLRLLCACVVGTLWGCGAIFGVDFSSARVGRQDASSNQPASDADLLDASPPETEVDVGVDAFRGEGHADADLGDRSADETVVGEAGIEGDVDALPNQESSVGDSPDLDRYLTGEETEGHDAGWDVDEPCDGGEAIDGVCVGECLPGSKGCSGSIPLTCGSSGAWEEGSMCDGDQPWCSDGACASEPPLGVLSTGLDHSCVVTRVGGVKCWGHNSSWKVTNSSPYYYSVPQDVPGLTRGIRSVVARDDYSCALTSAGRVRCWGEYMAGGSALEALATAPYDISFLPSSIRELSGGKAHVCILTKQGGIKCWGYNYWGQLGVGDNTNRWDEAPDVMGLASGVRSISAGDVFTCAITGSGGMKCWGYNNDGQLGCNGCWEPFSAHSDTPVDVGGLSSGVRQIAAGTDHTCAVMDSGAVWCWGRNQLGELGIGNHENHLTPTEVPDVDARQVAAADGSTCVVTQQSAVKCWGAQLGGTMVVPVDIVGLEAGVAQVACGNGFSCAMMQTGQVKCWGFNNWGQLGDGTQANSATPVDVVGF